jgi:hypothetical protein
MAKDDILDINTVAEKYLDRLHAGEDLDIGRIVSAIEQRLRFVKMMHDARPAPPMSPVGMEWVLLNAMRHHKNPDRITVQNWADNLEVVLARATEKAERLQEALVHSRAAFDDAVKDTKDAFRRGVEAMRAKAIAELQRIPDWKDPNLVGGPASDEYIEGYTESAADNERGIRSIKVEEA